MLALLLPLLLEEEEEEEEESTGFERLAPNQTQTSSQTAR